ncbi:MAG: DUF6364 family protein [Planctomycetota bacterium]|nr:DUF6364 family protein [Planctomycetota bacterium]
MQRKLTLRLDESLIKRAKAYARRSGKSVSQLVADYFSLLSRKRQPKADFTPSVRSLKGALKKRKVTVKDYGRYLEEKYL